MNKLFLDASRLVLDILGLAIFIRVISSWLPIPHNNQIIKLIYQITEPVLGPIRAMLQKSSAGRNSMMDFSPIIAILIITVLRGMLRK